MNNDIHAIDGMLIALTVVRNYKKTWLSAKIYVIKAYYTTSGSSVILRLSVKFRIGLRPYSNVTLFVY